MVKLINLSSKSIDELKALFVAEDIPAYRAKQLFQAIHQQHHTEFSTISVFSKKLRQIFAEKYTLARPQIFRRYDSHIDGTQKYLIELSDGNIIESVKMQYKHGISLCLSTQVGCRMGCSFCASTKEGLIRNLTAGEIIGQLYAIKDDINQPIHSIVLMGSGEPLDNFSSVLQALHLLHDPCGECMSYRHMTLSTCGLVPGIYKLSREKLPITLSISLHSPFDSERKKLMPIAHTYSIKELIEACTYYLSVTKRRITFEYTLIHRQNDQKSDAQALANLLKGMLCHVNLIPMNPIRESTHTPALSPSVIKFQEYLTQHGIPATIRRQLGADINAACGQLRRNHLLAKQKKEGMP